jgi:hypothetical protein
MVRRVALYPDPLLTQVLAASTFPDQIPDAARWADGHRGMRGDDLARAISAENLPWDPSVQSLLPFPAVLDRMASDMNWTAQLGNAFLSQQQDVMDAVQHDRKRAREFGYLHSSGQIIVTGGPYITIMPMNPAYIYVPSYDPEVVYVAPRPGFYVGGAIGFGAFVTLGVAFRPWGWGVSHVYWDRREMYVGDARWDRNWQNRTVYVHPYYRTTLHYEGPRNDRHDVRQGFDRPEVRHENEHPEVRQGFEHPENRPGYVRPGETTTTTTTTTTRTVTPPPGRGGTPPPPREEHKTPPPPPKENKGKGKGKD